MRLLPLLLLLALATPAVAGWPSLAEPARDPDRPGRKDGALIIAIEDYLLVDDVTGARANAADWDQWFDARGVPVARVVVLRDSEAVRESILRQAKQLATEMPAGGTLWVVYIGHGAPSADGQDGVLVGADAQQKAEILYARSVGRKELLGALKTGKQAETVVVLDACFSGKNAGGKALVPGLQPLVPTVIKTEGRVTLLTAGAGDEFAGGLPGVARPAFSYLALGALSGWREADADDDGAITLGEAVAYSRGALRRVATDRKQTPEIIGPLAGLKVAKPRVDGPNLRSVGGGRVEVAEVEPPEAPPAEAEPEAEPERKSNHSNQAGQARGAAERAAERSAAERQVRLARELAEGVCACRDVACAGARVEAARAHFDPEVPLSETDRRVIEAAATRIGACVKTLEAKGTPGPPPGKSEWRGHYVCAQGRTSMTLLIESWGADGKVVGRFEFLYAPKRISGAFAVRGRYDAAQRRLSLGGSEWIKQPENYTMVGLEGSLSDDGRRLTGTILDPNCSTFEVELE